MLRGTVISAVIATEKIDFGETPANSSISSVETAQRGGAHPGAKSYR